MQVRIYAFTSSAARELAMLRTSIEAGMQQTWREVPFHGSATHKHFLECVRRRSKLIRQVTNAYSA